MQTPRQIEEAFQLLVNMGGKMLCFYTVMGDKITLAIAEAPDEENCKWYLLGE